MYYAMPNILWLAYFHQDQYYKTKTNLQQDNLTEMLLEHNGNYLSINQTKHINVKYFFIKYIIVSDEIEPEDFQTENILANPFNNPFQRNKLR